MWGVQDLSPLVIAAFFFVLMFLAFYLFSSIAYIYFYQQLKQPTTILCHQSKLNIC